MQNRMDTCPINSYDKVELYEITKDLLENRDTEMKREKKNKGGG